VIILARDTKYSQIHFWIDPLYIPLFGLLMIQEKKKKSTKACRFQSVFSYFYKLLLSSGAFLFYHFRVIFASGVALMLQNCSAESKCKVDS